MAGNRGKRIAPSHAVAAVIVLMAAAVLTFAVLRAQSGSADAVTMLGIDPATNQIVDQVRDE